MARDHGAGSRDPGLGHVVWAGSRDNQLDRITDIQTSVRQRIIIVGVYSLRIM